MPADGTFSAEEWAVLCPVFLESARGHLTAMHRDLAALTNDPADRAALKTLHRAVHSLKGASLQLGLLSIGQTAAQFEKVVLRVGEQAPGASQDWLGLAERAIAALEKSLREIESDEPGEPDGRLLIEFDAWLAQTEGQRSGRAKKAG
jgi:chemotaxis protein histidine kinase CheA